METTPLEMEAMMGRTGCHWTQHLKNINTESIHSVTISRARARSHRDVQQEFSSRAVKDLHQIPDALLPDVERVLPRRPRHDVLAIT